jgi:acylphosphatase
MRRRPGRGLSRLCGAQGFSPWAGYTRNTESEDVEVVAQGPRPALEHLLLLLQQGPSAAAVDEVQTAWQKPTEHFRGFTIRW